MTDTTGCGGQFGTVNLLTEDVAKKAAEGEIKHVSDLV